MIALRARVLVLPVLMNGFRSHACLRCISLSVRTSTENESQSRTSAMTDQVHPIVYLHDTRSEHYVKSPVSVSAMNRQSVVANIGSYIRI